MRGSEVIISICLSNMLLATASFTLEIKDFKYFLEPEQEYSWWEALKQCQQRNMNLVTIDTKTKAIDVHRLVVEVFHNNNKQIPPLFIGANDLLEFREFVWTSTNDPFTYTNWRDHEPNNYNNSDERCVNIGHYGDVRWNDSQCSSKYGFICEKPLNPDDPSKVPIE
ncbi:lectin subunit alpha-like [Haematobia irritans]|uniref:lectin subunit alpha-like n=1 Tax=Haematobia irritans TaxID=7368 RepID=UPI003F4F5C7B